MNVQWLEAGESSETGRTPDLLISDGEEFIVEATTATETSD
jgi:hypothetical protein